MFLASRFCTRRDSAVTTYTGDLPVRNGNIQKGFEKYGGDQAHALIAASGNLIGIVYVHLYAGVVRELNRRRLNGSEPLFGSHLKGLTNF